MVLTPTEIRNRVLQRVKTRQAENKRLGNCITCGKTNKETTLNCKTCKQKKYEYFKKWIRSKQEAKICIWCGKQKTETKNHCAKCRKKVNEMINKQNRERYQKLKKQKKCYLCKKKAITKNGKTLIYCHKCKKRQQERDTRRQQCKY